MDQHDSLEIRLNSPKAACRLTTGESNRRFVSPSRYVLTLIRWSSSIFATRDGSPNIFARIRAKSFLGHSADRMCTGPTADFTSRTEEKSTVPIWLQQRALKIGISKWNWESLLTETDHWQFTAELSANSSQKSQHWHHAKTAPANDWFLSNWPRRNAARTATLPSSCDFRNHFTSIEQAPRDAWDPSTFSCACLVYLEI